MTNINHCAKTLRRMQPHREDLSMNASSTEKLQQLEAEYRKRIEAIDRDLSQPAEADFAEQVTQKENTDVLRSLKLEAEIEHRRVQAALDRAAKGHYGECTRCGEAVEAARLEAMPQAENCVRCANAA
jgi:RNA polymerase-binding transcription factor DksA